MPPSDDPPKPSTSGIQTTESGERHIPSSVRADGSVRKEIRIRPGYKPPEDVERYKNRATEDFRKPRGIPGAEDLKDPEAKESAPLTGAAAKNAKRKEARKRAAAAAAREGSDAANSTATAQADASSSKHTETTTSMLTQDAAVDTAQGKEKEAKKLSKKLRQAKELQAKKDQGGALLPEQFEKVIKINELIRQLDLLGFDTNGEKKADAT